MSNSCHVQKNVFGMFDIDFDVSSTKMYKVLANIKRRSAIFGFESVAGNSWSSKLLFRSGTNTHQRNKLNSFKGIPKYLAGLRWIMIIKFENQAMI